MACTVRRRTAFAYFLAERMTVKYRMDAGPPGRSMSVHRLVRQNSRGAFILVVGQRQVQKVLIRRGDADLQFVACHVPVQ